MSEHLYVIEAHPSCDWPSQDELDDLGVEVLASDATLDSADALIRTSHDTAQQIAQRLGTVALPPRAGRHQDIGGEYVYIDDNATEVTSAVEVVRSLDGDAQIQAAAQELGEGIFTDEELAELALENTSRCF